MNHFVLDGDVLAMALFAEKPDHRSIRSLLALARDEALNLWVHPHTVTNCLNRLQAGSASMGGDPGPPSLAMNMADLLEIVRLLPTPGVQLLQILHQEEKDVLTGLTILAAREYLEHFILITRHGDGVQPGVRMLSPEQCLESITAEQEPEQIALVDLKAQQQDIYPVLEANMFQVLKSCKFILGPEVEELERRLGDYVQMDHVVSCSSGTEALVLALMAFDIGPGDAVFTSPFTFIATAEVICLLGATPVFVDIDARTFNLDPEKLDAAVAALATGDGGYPLPQNAVGLRPKAVITVDLFGLPADHRRISVIAKKHGLAVIEDAAQSFGGQEHGRKACALGDIGCTSFFPAKPLAGYGEGGACFTKDAGLAEVMRSIRVHGQGASRYEHTRLGTNARLDSLQAAVLLAKMDVFPAELERRIDLAAGYSRLLEQCELITPFIPDGYGSAWAQYSLLARDETHRAACREALAKGGVPSVVYYPVPLHLQQVFQPLGYAVGDLPVCETTSRRIFSLPMHPYLKVKTQNRIAKILCSPDVCGEKRIS